MLIECVNQLLYIPSRAITDAIDEFFAVYLGAESDGLWYLLLNNIKEKKFKK